MDSTIGFGPVNLDNTKVFKIDIGVRKSSYIKCNCTKVPAGSFLKKILKSGFSKIKSSKINRSINSCHDSGDFCSFDLTKKKVKL